MTKFQIKLNIWSSSPGFLEHSIPVHKCIWSGCVRVCDVDVFFCISKSGENFVFTFVVLHSFEIYSGGNVMCMKGSRRIERGEWSIPYRLK